MFVVTVDFEIHPGHEAEFRAAVLEQARNSRSEEGCRQFDVCLDPKRSASVFLYELYDDAAAFDLHVATPYFARFNDTVAPWVATKTVRTWERAE
jgi:quinol monooxygenase YgiN